MTPDSVLSSYNCNGSLKICNSLFISGQKQVLESWDHLPEVLMVQLWLRLVWDLGLWTPGPAWPE